MSVPMIELPFYFRQLEVRTATSNLGERMNFLSASLVLGLVSYPFTTLHKYSAARVPMSLLTSTIAELARDSCFTRVTGSAQD